MGAFTYDVCSNIGGHVHKGPSTKDVRQMGRSGFEISDIPGRGEVVCESSDVRKFLKRSKFLRAL